MTKPRSTPVDLRSDTVTRPVPAMRQAIAAAEVGDDVLDGDPTVRRLEERVAALLGHESALFFPTGTQANQVAIGLHSRPGTEGIVDAGAHILHYEQAGAAQFWGVQLQAVPTPDGRLTPALVRPFIRPRDEDYPATTFLAAENTHNAGGGRVQSRGAVEALAELAREHDLGFHLDGARLWNAAVALGEPPAALGRIADTVMVCLSKGLGCPAGSCLAFPEHRRARAVEMRRRLGGGMRQSGVLAAAGLYALDHLLDRLPEDHANARRFAERLAGHPGVTVLEPETNIVMLDLAAGTARAAQAALRDAGVLVSVFGPGRLRVVTHLGVTAEEVDRAAEVASEVLAVVAEGVGAP